ncbi:MAG: 16S rRNA (uracil(1498)-N(3))-methyltransferase [bacterium]
MMHRRFFVNPESIVKNNVDIVDKDDIHHLKNVLRLKEKDKIIALDGLGNEYHATIISIAADKVKTNIVEKIIHPPQKVELTLLQALPRIARMDLIISKSTELGVTRIIPVKTQRSLINLKNESTKLTRWQKIAKSSSSQCQRCIIPIIYPVTNLKTSLELIKEVDLGLILYENAKTPLREVFLNRDVTLLKKIAVFVGPEGGFTEEEITAVQIRGIIPVSLGTNILRCESASIVTESIILYELGMIG